MQSTGGKLLRRFSALLVGAVLGFQLVTPAHGAALDVNTGGSVLRKEVKSLRELRFRNMVRQNTDYSCGAAALATILTYYFGEQISEEIVLSRILGDADQETLQRVMKSGLSLLDLKVFAESLGYGGKGFRLDKGALKRLDRPAIGLVNTKGYNHFVVIKQVSGEKVHLADPIKGNLVRPVEDFMRMWNGIVLVFENKGGDKVQSHRLVTGTEVPKKLNLLPDRIDLGFALDPSEF